MSSSRSSAKRARGSAPFSVVDGGPHPSARSNLIDPQTKSSSAFERAGRAEQASLTCSCKHAVAVRDNNLFLLLPDGSSKQLTTDGTPTPVYGQRCIRMSSGSMAGFLLEPRREPSGLLSYGPEHGLCLSLVHTNTRKATEEKLTIPWPVCPSHHVTSGSMTWLRGRPPTSRRG